MAVELDDLRLDESSFVELLRKVIGVSETLQNAPMLKKIPQENNCSDFVLESLAPYTKENDGPLTVERVEFTKGRGNIIITYPGRTDKTIALVGCHMDVVPANPEAWKRDPFKLQVEGDKLYGRGTTDCLGHVCLVTELFRSLAASKISLESTLVGVFIASEEVSTPGVGVDALMKAGKLDHLKDGPILWVDCADSQPCLGTAGSQPWKIKTKGKLFHSGLPHKGINSLELAMDAVGKVQERFYETYKKHPMDDVYKFATPSTMKPTRVEIANNGVNQIPPWTVVQGDIRLSPFYDMEEVKSNIKKWVAEFNNDIGQLENPTQRGPCSKYTLDHGDIRQGVVEVEFSPNPLLGIACNLESPSYAALEKAISEVKEECKPYSISGSLPLVKEMQESGFDIQLIGFGLMKTYHATNEYCSLKDMCDGFRVLAKFIKYNDGVVVAPGK